jgi:pSer/pThr/pTyr-binding forkhead associated (FHA) protein
MGNKQGPIPAGGVCVVLLDSAQGQPIQTWQFTNQAEISIGRDDGNDIVIPDPHVSRLHARLVAMDGTWMLISLGRHGTLVDDRLVADKEMCSGIVFRLGPTGPMLRFDLGKHPTTRSETMDQIDPDTLALLYVDEQRKQQEVEQIAGGALFEELLQESQRLKSSRKDGGGSG